MLSVQDLLKQRVLKAKDKIAPYKKVELFIEKFPEYKGKETRVKNVLSCMGSDLDITIKLESLAYDLKLNGY